MDDATRIAEVEDDHCPNLSQSRKKNDSEKRAAWQEVLELSKYGRRVGGSGIWRAYVRVSGYIEYKPSLFIWFVFLSIGHPV